MRRAIELGACDVVNLKVAGCGGFGPAREALREAREHGLEVFLSSTLDGPWGIAAALQLAAAEDVKLACGLATLDLFDARIAGVLPKPRGGLQLVPQGPGLGVPEDLEALDEVLVRLAREAAHPAPRGVQHVQRRPARGPERRRLALVVQAVRHLPRAESLGAHAPDAHADRDPRSGDPRGGERRRGAAAATG